jgi:transcriptional regulator with XRE-family HTH domain
MKLLLFHLRDVGTGHADSPRQSRFRHFHRGSELLDLIFNSYHGSHINVNCLSVNMQSGFFTFSVDYQGTFAILTQMDAQKATAAPGRFIRTLKDAMDMKGFSLRRLADKTGVSPAYLSRLFNRERGVPADNTIAKFEDILDIQPRGALFDAARRDDQIAATFKKITGARLLMRTLAPLTEAEMVEVQKVADRLAKQCAKDAK